MSEKATQADYFRLRAEFDNPTRLQLNDLEYDLAGLRSVLDIAMYIEVSNNLAKYEKLNVIYRGASGPDDWGIRLNARTFQVGRVSYNSPLEVVLWIPVVYGAAASAIKLFNKYQDARAKKAETDTLVDANRWMQAQIAEAAGSGTPSPSQEAVLKESLSIAGWGMERLTALEEDTTS